MPRMSVALRGPPYDPAYLGAAAVGGQALPLEMDHLGRTVQPARDGETSQERRNYLDDIVENPH
jgi:hypothetical protein